MWQDILTIHPDCEEHFLDFNQLPGKANKLIACAGLSTLRTEYQIGKTGDGEILDHKNKNRTPIHYLLATKSGTGKLTLDSGEYLLTPNTLVILPAGTPFLYEIAGEEWTMCWLLLHDCPQFQFINDLPPSAYQSEQAKTLNDTVSLLLDFKHLDGQHQADITLRLVEVLLLHIEQTLNKQYGLTPLQQKFNVLIKAVSKQLQRPWTVTELANKMHLSEPHFYRLCKQQTGLSPIKLLTRYRLEYACHLLHYTSYNLEQIAFSIGYADSASFAHRFKHQYGISPGRWRANQ